MTSDDLELDRLAKVTAALESMAKTAKKCVEDMTNAKLPVVMIHHKTAVGRFPELIKFFAKLKTEVETQIESNRLGVEAKVLTEKKANERRKARERATDAAAKGKKKGA